MRVAWVVAAFASAACASILGVDHDFTVGPDAGADGADPGVRCGDGGPYCSTPMKECCLDSEGGLGCIQRAGVTTTCPNGTDIQCDDSADCAGQACCITLEMQGYILSALCAQSSSCANGTSRLCDPMAPAPCGSGTCAPLMVRTFPYGWFHACQ
jgi:hypothetical protein